MSQFSFSNWCQNGTFIHQTMKYEQKFDSFVDVHIKMSHSQNSNFDIMNQRQSNYLTLKYLNKQPIKTYY